MAIEEAKKYFSAVGKFEVSDLLALAYDQKDYQGVMNLVAENLIESHNKGFTQAIWIARIFAYSGNKANALKWLNKAYNEGDYLMVNLNVSSDWDSLRGEPEFESLILQMAFKD